jgi:hypothetical protein
MARETELLYVVTLVIFILVCHLIIELDGLPAEPQFS